MIPHTRMLIATALVVLLPVFGHAADGKAPASAPLPKGHPQIPAVQQQPLPPLSGKILKSMDSGGYTYIHLRKKDGRKQWVAIPKTKVTVGKNIDLVSGEEFKNFESKTLNRTFDSIVFSLGPVPKKGKDGVQAGLATPGSTGAMVAAEKMSVAKAPGKNTYTVAELFAQKGTLNGKKVVVRGKVVKVVPRIMKMNWIHLQDGTGSAGKKNHDLVVKTKALPAMGETVTVSGTLLKDKDYGSGYKYDVLIDEADIGK